MMTTAPAARIAPRDLQQNFHGNQLLYILWERHLTICAPIALALPPDTSFDRLVREILPRTVFSQHPDWAKIDWQAAQWSVRGEPVRPAPGATLSSLSLGHKALLRLRTPGLDGIGGVGG